MKKIAIVAFVSIFIILSYFIVKVKGQKTPMLTDEHVIK